MKLDKYDPKFPNKLVDGLLVFVIKELSPILKLTIDNIKKTETKSKKVA
tara:strand:- start:366 stop:512 length:147 start_codon:yes stop_codon:yes gene_type:complete